MRQQLPETAGEALNVNDISRTVYPGEEFDAPSLVPGCVSLEKAQDSGEESAGSDGDAGGAEAAESRTEPPDDTGRAPGKTAKGT